MNVPLSSLYLCDASDFTPFTIFCNPVSPLLPIVSNQPTVGSYFTQTTLTHYNIISIMKVATVFALLVASASAFTAPQFATRAVGKPAPVAKKAAPVKAAPVKKVAPVKAVAKPVAKPVAKKVAPVKAVAKPVPKPVVKKAAPVKAVAKPVPKKVVPVKVAPKKVSVVSKFKSAKPVSRFASYLADSRLASRC